MERRARFYLFRRRGEHIIRYLCKESPTRHEKTTATGRPALHGLPCRPSAQPLLHAPDTRRRPFAQPHQSHRAGQLRLHLDRNQKRTEPLRRLFDPYFPMLRPGDRARRLEYLVTLRRYETPSLVRHRPGHLHLHAPDRTFRGVHPHDGGGHRHHELGRRHRKRPFGRRLGCGSEPRTLLLAQRTAPDLSGSRPPMPLHTPQRTGLGRHLRRRTLPLQCRGGSFRRLPHRPRRPHAPRRIRLRLVRARLIAGHRRSRRTTQAARPENDDAQRHRRSRSARHDAARRRELRRRTVGHHPRRGLRHRRPYGPHDPFPRGDAQSLQPFGQELQRALPRPGRGHLGRHTARRRELLRQPEFRIRQIHPLRPGTRGALQKDQVADRRPRRPHLDRDRGRGSLRLRSRDGRVPHRRLHVYTAAAAAEHPRHDGRRRPALDRLFQTRHRAARHAHREAHALRRRLSRHRRVEHLLVLQGLAGQPLDRLRSGGLCPALREGPIRTDRLSEHLLGLRHHGRLARKPLVRLAGRRIMPVRTGQRRTPLFRP